MQDKQSHFCYLLSLRMCKIIIPEDLWNLLLLLFLSSSCKQREANRKHGWMMMNIPITQIYKRLCFWSGYGGLPEGSSSVGERIIKEPASYHTRSRWAECDANTVMHTVHVHTFVRVLHTHINKSHWFF